LSEIYLFSTFQPNLFLMASVFNDVVRDRIATNSK